MQDDKQSNVEYFKLAIEMADRAYAPYSSFPVGCVIIDEEGRAHTGCNVENASFGLTICAERVATGNAVSKGAKQFRTIIVASRDAVSPCGACRQVLSQFSDKHTVVYAIDFEQKQQKRFLLGELLPDQFYLAPKHR